MRAVVKVKHSQGRAPSNAARYIAESKLDPEREEGKARPLFTNRGDDDLTYGDANRYLNDGPGRPAKGDLIHFSVSFREEDFEKLGATDEERKVGLREAAREAMDRLRGDLRIRDWRWVAAIHLNTPHPHIHFLISKEVTDERGKERRLGKIPKRLLPRMERGPGDAARSVEGKLGEHFVAALDRAQERAREVGLKRDETVAKTTTERLEERPGANRESPPASLQIQAEPGLRDAPVTGQAASQTHAINVVNKNNFKFTGAENEVYIGRAMPGIKGSVLGNPYRIGRDGTREEVIEKYRRELEREAPDMAQILSHSLEFDKPLVHQGIEYRTIDNFVNAMKTSDDDLATRRQIAAVAPDEARLLGAQLQVRPDWPEIHAEVLETALRHKFAPGTSWYARLRSTGDREITDNSKDNMLGRLLMDIREESKHRAPPIFLDRLNDETRAWVTGEVIPTIDKSVEAGISRQGILNAIGDQVSRRDLPAAGRDTISDFLEFYVDLKHYSDDKLFKLAGRNPSLGGRELTRELILGRTQSLNPASDIRQALANRSIDDTDYRTQSKHADWLGEHSQNIRDLYERGAEIKSDVLVIPTEEHEVPGERDGVRVIDISYAHKKFKNNPRLAAEFHRVCRTIAGETADIETEIKIFKHYYDQIEKDEAGRPLDRGDKDFKEKRAAALERTLEEMRVLASGMAREETKASADVARSIADLSYAYRRISDWKDAEHFHELGERLVGPEADLPTRVNVFNYYYSKLERDEEGHVLAPDDETGRAAALERTLAEMWLAVEKQETPEIAPNDPEYVAVLDRAAVDPEIMPETAPNAPANVPLVHTFTSFEEVGEWYHRQEAEREAEEEYSPPEQGTEYEADEYDAEELDSPEPEYTFDDAYSGRQADAAAWGYNTAARKAYLGGESLRFPEKWGYEKKERIVETTLPEIDRRIENGDPLYNIKDETGKVVVRGIISDINTFIYPDREEVLTRTASLAGWSGDQAKPGTLTYDELLEARSTLLDLSLQGRSSLESRRDLLESYQDLTERRVRGPLMAQTFRHLSQVEGLIETLTSDRPQHSADRERGRDSELYVSLAGEKDALRLPVSNIRVYEAIRQLTEGAKLDFYTWKGKDSPAIINGFTELEYDDRKKEAKFLKGYVHERLRDPETRLIQGNEVFREAHKSLALARSPEEVNRAADAIRNSDQFDERERKLLFFGRAPGHYSPKMLTLRRMWWLPQTDLVKALSEGRLAPSSELRELIAELSSRRSEGRVDYFYSALKNPPEKMRKPEESVRLGLWPKSQGLLSYEKAYLLEKTWEMKQSFAGRQSSLRETAPQLGESPQTWNSTSRKNESLRIYQAEFNNIVRSAVESRGFVSPEEMNVIRGEACRQAWARLELPESPINPPSDAARQLNEKIAELRERVQPQVREAAQALSGFIQARTGSDYPSDGIPQEALNNLEPADLQRLEELKKDAAAKKEELSRRFEMIDQLRQEIAQARSNKEVERTSSITAQTGVRAATDNRSAPASAQRIDSYREYTNHVAEIERGLIAEETRQKAGVEMGGNRNAQPDGLLTREEKLRIRVTAASLAWERIEPREIPANGPAEKQLTALSEAIKQLRDTAQSQARQAAVKLDEFIRSRNLDQFARQKTDYYYRADQIPRAEIQKLSPGDKREFAALEKHAAATFREFKNGFSAIDSLRLEIENTRNGAGDPHTLNGNGHPERRDSANGGGASPDLPGKDPTPDPDRGRMNDRIILGKAIITHARTDAAATDYERAHDHGHTFRFNIHDESLNGRRRISDLDVNRRADARGNRAADERGFERYDDRRAIHGQVSEADLVYHSTTLEQHGKRLDRLVKELEDKANVAGDSYRHARQRAEDVVEKYQNRGEQLPVPFIERETLVKTQDEAIKHGFAGHTERLERLRETLAEEHGQPARSDKEAARLAAQLFTARTEMKTQEERANRFDETRHLRRWEIGGEKFSLAEIDRRLKRATDEIHIFPGDRRQAKAEIQSLNGARAEVTRVIGEHQSELRGNVAEAGKLLDTLTRAYDRETTLREQAGLVMPAPQFTRRELDRAADNIESTRDAAALRELSEFERSFNTYSDQKERFTSQEELGRAPGRALMAMIFHRESYERLAAFEQRGEVQPLLVETSDDRILTQKLQDTRPQWPIEWLVRPLIEKPSEREIRQGTQAAFAQYETNLRAEFEKTRFYQEAAMGIAVELAAERNTLAGRDLPAPEVTLTPKQAMTLEIYAERQANPEVRDQLLSLARGSTQSHFDAHSQARSAEPGTAREAAPDPGRGR